MSAEIHDSSHYRTDDADASFADLDGHHGWRQVCHQLHCDPEGHR